MPDAGRAGHLAAATRGSARRCGRPCRGACWPAAGCCRRGCRRPAPDCTVMPDPQPLRARGCSASRRRRSAAARCRRSGWGRTRCARPSPGSPSLRRLKSIFRYSRLAPPPRWREVLRPRGVAPAGLLQALGERLLRLGAGDLGEVRIGDEPPSRRCRLGLADRHYSAPSRPRKIGIVSPSRTWTMAFFH